jgi:hypothetical protein
MNDKCNPACAGRSCSSVAPVVLACQVVQPGQQPVGADYACWHPFILVYTGLPHMWHACHTASVAYILLLSVRCSRSRPERPARPLRYNPSGGPQTQARRIIPIADCGDLASTRARCPRDIYAHGRVGRFCTDQHFACLPCCSGVQRMQLIELLFTSHLPAKDGSTGPLVAPRSRLICVLCTCGWCSTWCCG